MTKFFRVLTGATVILSLILPVTSSEIAHATGLTWSQPGAQRIGWTYSADSNQDDSSIVFHPRSIAYGNGTFVAVSDNYQTNTAVETSPDGNIWTPRVADTSTQWNTVVFGGGIFVALGRNENGDASVGMKSTDGINWSSITPADTNVEWLSMAYGGGRFVAVGRPLVGNPTRLTMYSDNGISWSLGGADNGEYWNAITYGDGKFVAVGRNPSGQQNQDVITSSDGGANWSRSGSVHDVEWSAITFGNHTFIAASQWETMSSPDGITWTETANRTYFQLQDSWFNVIYAAGKFVLIGDNGGGNEGKLAVSTDGINWEYQQIGLGRYWGAAAFGNNRLVIVNYEGQKMFSSLQYSIPSYVLLVSSIDYYTNQQYTELCESCTVTVYARLARSDGAILDTLTSVSVSSSGAQVIISGQNPQQVDSSGSTQFNIQGNGSGAGSNVSLHFQATTFPSAQGDISFNIVGTDQTPQISTSNGNGGALLTVSPAQSAIPNSWEFQFSVNQSSDPVACSIDDTQPIIYYADGEEPYTIQPGYPYENFVYQDSSNLWLLSIYRETSRIPTKIFLPGLHNGCRYDLSLHSDRQGYSTPNTLTTFLYSTPSTLSPAFILSSPSETVSAGSAISGYQIISTGGVIQSYSISPSPSNGTLAFNTATGLLSGTPSNSGRTSFVITGHNSTAPDLNRIFVLNVQGGNPPSQNNSSSGNAVNRQKEIEKSRIALLQKIREKKEINSSDIVSADLLFSSEGVLPGANMELQLLHVKLNGEALTIEDVKKVLLRESVVDKLANPKLNYPLFPQNLVSAKFISESNPNKTYILLRLQRLPISMVNSVEKVELEIRKLEAEIKFRKEKLAKLGNRAK
jgi:hypothetical protein